jgi:PAS domain S-box-containing protein
MSHVNGRRWASFILLILLAANLVACASVFQEPSTGTTGPTTDAPEGPPLLFLGNKNIAPVVYLDGTDPSGVAVDLVHALAQHVSRPVEVRAMDWTEAQALVAEGKADALIQINVTEQRKKLYDFSEPFLESHFSIFVRSDEMGMSGISSLHGLRVGVESGGLPRQTLGRDPRIRLVTISTFLEGFTRLNEGSIDAVVVDYRVGSYILAQNGIRNIKVTGEPIESSYSSIAVKKGNTQLLGEINRGLRTIKADGTYQRILKNWAPTETVFETQEQIHERIYRTIAFSSLALLVIAIAWVLTIRRQLSRRRATEERSKRQYSTLRSIIDSTNTPIFSVDRQYCYTSFNQGHAAAMKALYGARIELGQGLLDYFTVSEDREAAKANLDRALAGDGLVEEAYSGEELRSRRYFQVSHSPIRTEAGEVIGVAVLAQDITERKRVEDQIRRLNQELEQRVRDRTRQLEASKEERDLAFRELQLAHARILQQEKMASIGQLAAGIAHEINTPTQYLSDNLAFLQQSFPQLVKTRCTCREPTDRASGDGTAGATVCVPDTELAFLVEEIPHALQESLTGVQRIASIVGAMKDFAYRGSDQPEPADLSRIISSAAEMSRNEWKLVARLEVCVDPETPMVTCLQDRLGQVLLNLLVNAAHAIADAHRGPGTGRIRVSTRREGEWVEIQVQDNGCGIPQELQPRIFEPFFTTKPVGRGTGQGLAIAYDIIVNAHQGQVHVDSEVGVGTTFTVRLPARGPRTGDQEKAPDMPLPDDGPSVPGS